MIEDGRVTVNGRPAELGMKVNLSRDVVRVDHYVVEPLATEWVALHKPRGFVTTRDDPSGRKTIYDLLPEEALHLFHVGRLDRDSSGLLLLTNDGEAANRLLHPRYETAKEYRVDVEGTPSKESLRRLVDGVRLEDGIAQAESVELREQSEAGTSRLVLVVKEGRNREVRRMFEAIGHPVYRLFRRAFGPIEVGKLKVGEWRKLTREEIALLTASGPGAGDGAARSPGGRRPSAERRETGEPREGRGSSPARRQSGAPRGRPASDRAPSDRPSSGRSSSERTSPGRSSSERLSSERPSSERPSSGRSSSGRSASGRSSSGGARGPARGSGEGTGKGRRPDREEGR